MSKQGAMYWVLFEAGYTAREARHIEKALDVLRLCNQGSDDLAGRLLDWKNMKLQVACNTLHTQIQRMNARGCTVVGLPDVDSLFKDDFQTAS